MQEEILTLQFGPFSNRVLNHFWDIEQLNAKKLLEESPDAAQNSIFMKNDPMKPRVIIFEQRDNLDKYSNAQTSTKNAEKEKSKFGLWDKSKIQVISSEEEKKEEHMTKSAPLSYANFTLTERNFMKVPPMDNYFNMYLHGKALLENAGQTDLMEDKIRYYLEDSDALRGFQCFLDANSGFGSINKWILQYLNEECPKVPIFQFALDHEHYTFDKKNEKVLEGLQYLNNIVNLYELKDLSTFYFPIHTQNLLKFGSFNPLVHSIEPKTRYNLLGLLIGNISLPYRATYAHATSNSIKQFTDKLLPYPELNIFNACFHLNGYPQVLRNPGAVDGERLCNIFNYKEYKPLTFLGLPNDKGELKKYTTFAEDYVLRGGLKDIKIPKEQTAMTYNFHLQETDVLITDDIAKLIDPNVLESFGTVERGPNLPPISKLSVHSCIFNNEIVKFYMEEVAKGYKMVERGAKLQYIKEDYTEDEFKEMESFYHSLRDSYDVG